MSVNPKICLQELVMTISKEMSKGRDKADYDVVRKAMESYDADAMEWKRFEHWCPEKKYTRNLIASDNETFNLILLCWNPDKTSPVHDHPQSECFFRVISGCVTETVYDTPNVEQEDLVQTKVTQCKQGSVAFMNDSLGLHSVGTPNGKPAITMHCYLPPFDECKCFVGTKNKYSVGTVTFYSEHGDIIKH